MKRLFSFRGINKKIFTSPYMIVFVYILIVNLWIFISDITLKSIMAKSIQLIQFHIYMDCIFVLIIGLLLFFYVKSAIHALREKEAETQEIIDYIPIASVVMKKNGEIEHLNEKFISTFGYDSHDIKTIEDWWPLAYPDPQYRENLQKLWVSDLNSTPRENHEIESPVVRITDKYQKVHDIHFKLKVLKGRMIVILTDITEQKRAENALRESEIRYRTLFESAGDAIFIMENERFIDCNHRTLEIFGCNREQIINHMPFEFSPEYQSDGRDSKEKALEKIHNALQGEPQFFEWAHRKFDGTFFDAEISLNKVVISEEIFVQAIVRDISKRKEDEKALRYRSDFVNLILNISTRFINLPSEQIDENIETALGELYRFVGADGGYLFRFSDDFKYFTMTHLCVNENLTSRKEDLKRLEVNKMPWWMDQLHRKQVVNVPSVDKLPGVAVVEKKIIESQGIKSLVDVPLVYKDNVFGVLGFNSAQENRNWTEMEISLLKVIGQIFTSALLRKEHEEVLRKSERNYREIFNSTNDGIAIHDVDSGIILDANQAFLDMFGYTLNETVTFKTLDLCAHDTYLSPKVLQERFRNAIKNETQIFECKAKTKEGKIFWIEISFKMSEIGGKNRILSLFRNINERKKYEDALKDSESRYREIFENANESICVVQDNYISFLNLKTSEILGYSRSEIVTMPITQFIHPDDRALILNYNERRLNGEDVPSRYTFRIVDKNQKTVWININVVLIAWNEKPAILIFMQDITDQRYAEDALKQSEERLKLALEGANDGLWDYNLQIGQIYFSPRCFTMLGYEPAAYPDYQKKWPKLVPKDVYELAKQKMRQYLENEGDYLSFEFSMDTKNGESIWILSRGKAVQWDSEGRILRIVGTLSDITKRKKAENALREREALLNSVIENLPFDFWARDLTGRCFLQNVVSKKYWGNLIGNMPEEQNVSALTLNLWEANNERVMAGQVVNEEVRYKDKRGRWGDFQNIVAPIKDNNKILGMMGLNIDISERKKILNALKKSEERFRNMAENIQDGLTIIENGKITFMNDRICEIMGLPREKAMQTMEMDLAVTEEKPRLKHLMNEVRKTGKHPDQLEYWIKGGDGVKRYIYNRFTLLKKNKKSFIDRYTVTTDITERKKAEEALKSSESRLSLIFNSVNDMIILAKVTLDNNFIAVAVNKSMLREMNLSEQQLLGKNIKKVLAKEYSKLLINNFKKVILYPQNNSFEKEEYWVGKKYLEYTHSAILDDKGQCTHILAVLHDITERKRREEAVQIADRASRLASLGTMAAGISHEINQPLTALKVKVDSLLYWGEEKPELMEKNLEQNLSFISKEADKIDEIIKHMRSLSQIDSIPMPEKVDVNNVIKNVISLIGQQLIAHEIKTVFNLDKSVPFALAHKTPMEQVIINLALNAMHALDTLDISNKKIIFTTKKDNRNCIIEIEDNGPGIEEKYLDKIFDPFFTTKVGKEGMGLGLSIVQNIITSVGGTITAYNREKGGALFRLTLPIKN
ncbi:PAS domain S-box protein [candidate division KSB1 bacterium]|nr:PAS domain S-box protein [candidate division KSB1 bacterium]